MTCVVSGVYVVRPVSWLLAPGWAITVNKEYEKKKEKKNLYNNSNLFQMLLGPMTCVISGVYVVRPVSWLLAPGWAITVNVLRGIS